MFLFTLSIPLDPTTDRSFINPRLTRVHIAVPNTSYYRIAYLRLIHITLTHVCITNLDHCGTPNSLNYQNKSFFEVITVIIEKTCVLAESAVQGRGRASSLHLTRSLFNRSYRSPPICTHCTARRYRHHRSQSINISYHFFSLRALLS